MQLVLRSLAFIYLAYLAIALLIVLPALNFLPQWYVKNQLGRELHSEIILFNPFTIALEVREAELPELDGERFVGLHNATVNLSLASLWREGWVFDEISTQGLYVHVRQLSADSFNFSDMLPEEETEPEDPEQAPAAIPGLTINRLELQAEEFRFSNEAREEPYSSFLQGLDIAVSDLSTILEEGRPYHINATGEGGGKLRWEGVVSVPGGYSEGHIALTNLSMPTLMRVAQPWFNFRLHDGRLGFQGDYRVEWKDQVNYSIDAGAINISSVDLQPRHPDILPDTAVSLVDFSLSGVTIDSTQQHASIAAIVIDGLAVAGALQEQQVSLAQLFAVNDLPADTEPDEDAQTDSSEPSAPWTASIESTRLTNSEVLWRSPFTDPQLLQVSPLGASLGRITWPFSGATDMQLELGINDVLSAGINGALALESGSGTLTYRLDGLPLAWFNPNFPAALKARITGGELATQGQVTLADFAPVTILNGGEISNFSGRVQDTEEALTSWEAVRWEELTLDLDERDLALQKLYINHYSGRVHIQEDGSVNTQKVWQEEVGEKAQEVAEDLTEGKPWNFALPQIVVSDSAIDFMDESLPINFRTVIGDLNGEILGISSSPGAQAKVDMHGTVDGYAPVSLKGTAAPLSEPPAIDLALNFTGVDLALLTPYSANYAGYAIDRGLLTLKLQYKLENSRLDGNNNVMVDQLKLGEKIDSEDAVDLPLELALALLTDSNGVISMEVPVSGDVDDPQFDVSSVIFDAFLNIIVKAVTAPFSLLANLVGSDEDLQRVNFAIGSALLDENGKTRLSKLSEALLQRPSLKLVISGRINREADAFSLQQAVFNQQLLDTGLAEEDLRSKSSQWEKSVNASYQTLATGAAEDSLTMAVKFEAVVRTVSLPANALQELAEARAVAVKTYLVNDLGLAADRAVIEQTAVDDPAQLFSGVELNVDG